VLSRRGIENQLFDRLRETQSAVQNVAATLLGTDRLNDSARSRPRRMSTFKPGFSTFLTSEMLHSQYSTSYPFPSHAIRHSSRPLANLRRQTLPFACCAAGAFPTKISPMLPPAPEYAVAARIHFCTCLATEIESRSIGLSRAISKALCNATSAAWTKLSTTSEGYG
jgi:hypothetical protein